MDCKIESKETPEYFKERMTKFIEEYFERFNFPDNFELKPIYRRYCDGISFDFSSFEGWGIYKTTIIPKGSWFGLRDKRTTELILDIEYADYTGIELYALKYSHEFKWALQDFVDSICKELPLTRGIQCIKGGL